MSRSPRGYCSIFQYPCMDTSDSFPSDFYFNFTKLDFKKCITNLNCLLTFKREFTLVQNQKEECHYYPCMDTETYGAASPRTSCYRVISTVI